MNSSSGQKKTTRPRLDKKLKTKRNASSTYVFQEHGDSYGMLVKEGPYYVEDEPLVFLVQSVASLGIWLTGKPGRVKISFPIEEHETLFLMCQTPLCRPVQALLDVEVFGKKRCVWDIGARI